MPWKHAAGAARLAGAVLGACLALSAAPINAQEATLQASFADRLYVLVERSGRFTLAEEGGDAMPLPGEEGEVYDALAALDSGWLAAGHRPARRGGGRELVLLHGSEGRVEGLPAPPSGERLLASPRPLVESGALVGLAWLEGDDSRSLGIRAARWQDGGFGAAEWVAPPSEKGSQLALSATVLRDGTWLLVWSAFDGGDDEILSSWRDGSQWTAPARLHGDNQVPDITPALAATAQGAVAAWSRYEAGHYRVRVARFRNGQWEAEERLGGPGSVFPFFVADGDGRAPHLVFPQGAAGAWELVALGGAGEVRARSRYQGGERQQPLLRRGAGGSARLEWVGAGSRRAGDGG